MDVETARALEVRDRKIAELEAKLSRLMAGIFDGTNEFVFGTGDGAAVVMGHRTAGDAGGYYMRQRFTPGIGPEFSMDGEDWYRWTPSFRDLRCVGGATAGTDTRPGLLFQIQDIDGRVVSVRSGSLYRGSESRGNGLVQLLGVNYQLIEGGTVVEMLTEDPVGTNETLWFQEAAAFYAVTSP